MQGEIQRCFTLGERGSYLRNYFFCKVWIFWRFGFKFLSAGIEFVPGSACQW